MPKRVKIPKNLDKNYFIEHPLIPKFLITLLEGKMKTTEAIKKSKFPQGTFYSSQLKAHLIAWGLLSEQHIIEGRTKSVYLELTMKGRQIAEKLAYVFDDSLEVVPIPRNQYHKLAELLSTSGEGTVEDFLIKQVREKLDAHAR